MAALPPATKPFLVLNHRKPKRGKLTGEYIEYMEAEIKMEIKLEDTDEELE